MVAVEKDRIFIQLFKPVSVEDAVVFRSGLVYGVYLVFGVPELYGIRLGQPEPRARILGAEKRLDALLVVAPLRRQLMPFFPSHKRGSQISSPARPVVVSSVIKLPFIRIRIESISEIDCSRFNSRVNGIHYLAVSKSQSPVILSEDDVSRGRNEHQIDRDPVLAVCGQAVRKPVDCFYIPADCFGIRNDGFRVEPSVLGYIVLRQLPSGPEVIIGVEPREEVSGGKMVGDIFPQFLHIASVCDALHIRLGLFREVAFFKLREILLRKNGEHHRHGKHGSEEQNTY